MRAHKTGRGCYCVRPDGILGMQYGASICGSHARTCKCRVAGHVNMQTPSSVHV